MGNNRTKHLLVSTDDPSPADNKSPARMSQRGTPRMTPYPSARGTPHVTPGSRRSTPRQGGLPLPALSRRSARSAPAQGYPMAYMPQQVDFQHASPGLDKYQCLVQKNGKMSHPGLVLPPRFQSTQGLFSPGANGYVAGRIPVGSCSSLQNISHEVPSTAPRAVLVFIPISERLQSTSSSAPTRSSPSIT